MPLIPKRHLDSIVFQGGLELVDFCDLILGQDQGLMAFLTQGPQGLVEFCIRCLEQGQGLV